MFSIRTEEEESAGHLAGLRFFGYRVHLDAASIAAAREAAAFVTLDLAELVAVTEIAPHTAPNKATAMTSFFMVVSFRKMKTPRASRHDGAWLADV